MSIRVLVVDDTVVFRRAISEALAGLPGVEVVGTASNGKLALARIQALQPDLVTLDIEMPEMNGIEVLESMRTAGLKTGVIMLSSLTRRGGEMTVRALELGRFRFPDRNPRPVPRRKTCSSSANSSLPCSAPSSASATCVPASASRRPACRRSKPPSSHPPSRRVEDCRASVHGWF